MKVLASILSLAVFAVPAALSASSVAPSAIEVANSRNFQSAEQLEAAIPFFITIEKSGKTIWRGSLSVSSRNGRANFSQRKNEFVSKCYTPGSSGRYNTSNENLNLSLSSVRNSEGRDDFQVNLTLVLPVDPCEGGGTSTVGLERTVTIERGATVRIEGEGGLALTLARKD